MKTFFFALMIITLVRCQIMVSPSTACVCSQFLYSNGCNYNTLGQCSWSTKNSNCEQALCSNMATIQECLIARNRCYWNGNKCEDFEQCQNLVSQDSLICPEQNIQCYGTNQNRCQPISSLLKCSKYTQTQCGQQGGYAGSDGLCYYNGAACAPATECSQITSEQVCNKYIQNACVWQNGGCVQSQCSQLNVNTCKFIIQNLNPDTVLSCFWTGTQCVEGTSQLFLDQQQCQSNTLLNYRWVQFQNSGICVSCAKQYMVPANACSCSQFIFQIDCAQAQYCTWTGTTCISTTCNQITNQLSCSSNLNCYWNIITQNCSQFYSCTQLSGSSNLQCVTQSQNCPNYMTGTGCYQKLNQCSQYGKDTCDGTFGLNGYCYYDSTKQTCNTLTSCTQIINEQTCNQLTQVCSWTNGACSQVQCSNIKASAKCTYVAKGLNSTDIQACLWTGSECVKATNLLTLGDANCASNTALTYYYTGSMCIKCNNIQVNVLPNQCACSQLQFQNDCQSNPQCTWNYNSSCSSILCGNITEQNICVQNLNCQWTQQGCTNFRACSNLQGKNQKECLAQSLNCPSSDGTYCQNRYFLKECNTIKTAIECLNALGSDGLCLWNSTNSECGILSSCGQILNQKNCGIYEYACSWTKAGSCIASSCATFTTVQQCKFYYSSINSQRPIGCQWNADNNTCSQVGTYMTSFTSSTCYVNTGHTARWNNVSGIIGFCVSCSQKYTPNPWKCSCQQIVSQVNCFQNKLCQWDTATIACTEKQCSDLEEPVCVTNHKCQWSGKACVAFTSCSQLNGTSNDECLSYSLFCPYNKKAENCGDLSQVVTCSDFTQNECGVLGIGYINCTWNYQLNKCQVFTYCSYFNYLQSECQKYSFMCYWNGSCLTRQCSNYETKQSCTYVYDVNKPNFMQSCQWLNGQCQNNIGQQFSDAQSCYSNSDGTSRWSSNTPSQGFCIPCGLPTSLVRFNDSCQCNQLLNQSECTSQFCYWNGSNCSENSCYSISSQFLCIQKPLCYWNVQYQQCSEWNVKFNFCQSLKGNSSLECLAQSGSCPISLNGICQFGTQLQTCSSIKNENMCINSIGQEGLCTYENQSCRIITSCTQIKAYNTCLSLQHNCQWDSNTNSCIQLLCDNITVQSECTYIFQSVNSLNLQYCEWNLETGTCSAVSITQQNKTLQNCYSSTGGTYHWSNTLQKGYCVTCALNSVTMPDTCSCSQLSEIECALAYPKCISKGSGSCVDMACNAIFESMNCSQVSSCMWQSGQCVPFTKCSEITGTTILDCLAQSKLCPGVTEGKCQSKSDLSQCSSYTQSTCTFGMSANDGLCYWNDTACITIKDCGSLSSISLCSSLIKMCKWSEYFGNCVPQKCQDYATKDLCTYVIVNLNNPFIELCQWQNEICQPYQSDYYRYDEETCYENSAHTYRWVKDDKRNTRCQMCYSSILYVIISILIMIHL